MREPTRLPHSSVESTTRRPWRESPAPEPLEIHDPAPARSLLRRALSPPGLAALVVLIAVLTIAATTVLTQTHEPGFDQVDEPLGIGQLQQPGESNAADDTELGGSAELIVVHVVGEVATPGVVELPAGSRLSAAIDAAGGATDAAVLSSVNLARLLTDGEQITVPNAEQVVAAEAGAGTETGAVVAGGLVSLNGADAAALEQLPRVGPSLAQRILDWREAHGPFTSVDQLLDVSGIGQKTFDDLRDLVTL